MNELSYIPPQNLDAETAILGAVLLDNSVAKHLSYQITPEDFYKNAHSVTYASMLELYRAGEPIDIITLSNRLKNANKLDEVGGNVFLVSLASNAVTSANASKHAEIIRNKSQLRQILKICNETASKAYADAGVDEILSGLRLATQGIVRGHGGEIVTIKEVMVDTFEYVEKRCERKGQISGLPTGFRDLDELLDGLQKQYLIVMAGRPSMGKTALATNIAENVASRKIPVGVVSIEMGKHPLGIRSLARQSGVEMVKIRKGMISKGEWPKLTNAVAKMVEMPIFYSFTSSKTGDIEKVCTQMVELHNIELLVVDYIQLTKSSGNPKSREQEVSEVSRLLKLLANNLNISVIGLAQLNREVERRENKRPMLSDLRESGAIEQDADVVMFIYKDDPKAPKCKTEIIIAKGRNEALGTVELFWNGDIQKFDDYDGTHDEWEREGE